MIQVLFTLTSLIIGTSNLYEQEVRKCDVSVVLATQNKAGQLTQKDVTGLVIVSIVE